MTGSRDRKGSRINGLAGGMAMFAAEALIVAGLAAVAWLIAVVVLAIL